jgi:ADP-heptose:LPS heptosyltransferase
MNSQYQNICKIGILRALYLGDMLCIIPTVRAVRKAFPDAQITLIGLPWEQHFVERFHHYFDDFVEFPGWPDLPEQKINAARIIEFLRSMQHRKFDLLLQMQGNGESTNVLSMLFGAVRVCGLRKKNEYTPDHIHFPISEDNDHEILRFLKLADVLQIPHQGNALEFPMTSVEIHRAQTMLKNMNLVSGRFVCIHPGARDSKRRWSAENFACAGDFLVTEGYTVLLTGSGEEAPVLQAVEDKMKFPAVNLVKHFGHVGLGELGYLLTQSAVLLSNDTGVSHVAAALEVPSVIIFSRFSEPARWAPLNSDLHKIVLSEHRDSMEEVFHHLTEQLAIPVGS